MPSDEPYGLFVDNNDTFAFSQKPLEAGQHYTISVFYYTPTGGGAEEASGEIIFDVDVYPKYSYGETYTVGSSQYQILSDYSDDTSPQSLGLYERIKSGTTSTAIICPHCNETTASNLVATPPDLSATCANCGASRVFYPSLSTDTSVSNVKYYYKRLT